MNPRKPANNRKLWRFPAPLAAEICARHAEGDNQTTLAKEYGLTQQLVSWIVKTGERGVIE